MEDLLLLPMQRRFRPSLFPLLVLLLLCLGGSSADTAALEKAFAADVLAAAAETDWFRSNISVAAPELPEAIRVIEPRRGARVILKGESLPVEYAIDPSLYNLQDGLVCFALLHQTQGELLFSSCFAREDNGARAFAGNPRHPRLFRMSGLELGQYACAIKAYSSQRSVSRMHVTHFWLRAATRSFELLDSSDFGQSVQLTGLGDWYRPPPAASQGKRRLGDVSIAFTSPTPGQHFYPCGGGSGGGASPVAAAAVVVQLRSKGWPSESLKQRSRLCLYHSVGTFNKAASSLVGCVGGEWAFKGRGGGGPPGSGAGGALAASWNLTFGAGFHGISAVLEPTEEAFSGGRLQHHEDSLTQLSPVVTTFINVVGPPLPEGGDEEDSEQRHASGQCLAGGGAVDDQSSLASGASPDLRGLHSVVAPFEVMGGTFETDEKNAALIAAVEALPLTVEPVLPHAMNEEYDDSPLSSHQASGERKAPLPPTVCEVGFNAGYSAVTFLSHHPTARVVSFDIGDHAASFVGKAWIDLAFPDRHVLVLGDSRLTLAAWRHRCDLFFIDGGHEHVLVNSDMKNAHLIALEWRGEPSKEPSKNTSKEEKNGSEHDGAQSGSSSQWGAGPVVVFDDMTMEGVRLTWEEGLRDGYFLPGSSRCSDTGGFCLARLDVSKVRLPCSTPSSTCTDPIFKDGTISPWVSVTWRKNNVCW